MKIIYKGNWKVEHLNIYSENKTQVSDLQIIGQIENKKKSLPELAVYKGMFANI